MLFNKFYLDKEKDIIIELYKANEDEISYILRTPNHHTGNLITNIAKLCNIKTVKDANDMKIIRGKIPASINGDNEIVYILRLGGIKIANIFEDGRIEQKAKIPAIAKTLMSQTKDYNLPIEKTIVKSYILKKYKFKTDLHTHMNANLSPDVLIALGIAHQIKYPLYYIKKLGLKITKEQEKDIFEQRKEVEKQFEFSELKGKYLIRRIDDNTFINFADFILNNLENADYNIPKIRASLAILKDGQAVFTNLEKVYLYRYIFAKGIESDKKINLDEEKIDAIPEKDIIKYIKQMIEDHKKDSQYKNNNLRQDKLLWIAREYQKQGISYVEIANTDLVKLGLPAIEFLEEVHEVMPKIEKETGVSIRFLAAIRRIPLTIIKDQKTSETYLRENLDVLKAVAKSPYVVGSDFIGEEINDISELSPVINELVKYVVYNDNKFTIRIHAGENDSLRDNIFKSIQCVKEAVPEEKNIPKIRIGHGLYTPDLDSKKGKILMGEIKSSGAVLEFQMTSNVRLNNLNEISRYPLKKYLNYGIKCVQGTDGCGFYGVDTIEEQLALSNLLGLKEQDLEKMVNVENEIISESKKYFNQKQKEFEKFLKGRSIRDAILELEEENSKNSSALQTNLRINLKLDSERVLKDKIKKLPEEKMPIIIAGGSFNSKGKETKVSVEGRKILVNLVKNIDYKKAYFIIGHKMEGYEKELVDIIKEYNKKIEVDAIIPKMITEEDREKLIEKQIKGICISIESEELGIYKSFNYEIFERRKSIVIAFDGNSPVANLIQEAKNGKGKSKIYVNTNCKALKEKAKSLEGYVVPFDMKQNVVDIILKDVPEIVKS